MNGTMPREAPGMLGEAALLPLGIGRLKAEQACFALFGAPRSFSRSNRFKRFFPSRMRGNHHSR